MAVILAKGLFPASCDFSVCGEQTQVCANQSVQLQTPTNFPRGQSWFFLGPQLPGSCRQHLRVDQTQNRAEKHQAEGSPNPGTRLGGLGERGAGTLLSLPSREALAGTVERPPGCRQTSDRPQPAGPDAPGPLEGHSETPSLTLTGGLCTGVSTIGCTVNRGREGWAFRVSLRLSPAPLPHPCLRGSTMVKPAFVEGRPGRVAGGAGTGTGSQPG